MSRVPVGTAAILSIAVAIILGSCFGVGFLIFGGGSGSSTPVDVTYSAPSHGGVLIGIHNPKKYPVRVTTSSGRTVTIQRASSTVDLPHVSGNNVVSISYYGPHGSKHPVKSYLYTGPDSQPCTKTTQRKWDCHNGGGGGGFTPIPVPIG